MSDEDLIGYLFDLLDPEDRAAVVARVGSDPDVAARLEMLRAVATPVFVTAEAERDDPPEPPPGLAVRAIAKVARYVVEHEPRAIEPEPAEPVVTTFLREFASDAPVDFEFEPGTRAKVPGVPTAAAPPVSDGPDPQSGHRFRIDLIVAAGIAFLGFGLLFSGIAKARQQQRVYACQNNLLTLHTGLTGYAEAKDGHYPQIGTTGHPTADTFATELTDLGQLPAGYRPGCPTSTNYVAYAYTRGFREPGGNLRGLRRSDGLATEGNEHDLMPISADFPTVRASPGAGPVSPHAGCMNVLFVGGNVRLTTSPFVGPGGDDIYRNVFGHVGAGVDRNDAVLGRPGDRP